MAVRTTSWLSLPSMLRTLLSHARLSVRLLRDPSVPFFAKLLPLGAVLYLIFPIDWMPDFIPVLGQLDDIGVLLLALESFLKLCPGSIVAHHQAAMAAGRQFSRAPSSPAPDGEVFDAEFRRDDRVDPDPAPRPNSDSDRRLTGRAAPPRHL